MTQELKARLGKLRTTAGVPMPQQTVAHDSVADRLARAAGARRRPTAKPSDQVLAHRWGGEVTAAGLIEIEQRIALSDRRAFTLHKTLVGGLPDVPVADSRDWVFLDTETTGLAGGSGTLAFLLGLARPADDALIVRQYLLTGFGGEAAMLANVARWIGTASLISYNGRSFDAPLLSTRCRMTGRPDWVSSRAHLDLLYGVRRAYARAWPNCRLATVEQRLLGLVRQDDLPGAEAPAAWFAHVRSGDASLLGKVLHHNRQDVVSLAQLLPKLVDIHARPGALNADVEAVASSWMKAGEEARAVELLERDRDALSHGALHLLARLQRRSGNLSYAYGIWRELAMHEDLAAIEQLAKYYEHVRKDLDAALRWASRLPVSDARSVRLERLMRKAAQSVSLGLAKSVAGSSM